MMEVAVTPEPMPTPSQVRVLIPCAGKCKGNKSMPPKWTGQIFIRLDRVPRGKAMIYACTRCGSERRYGLLGLSSGVEDD